MGAYQRGQGLIGSHRSIPGIPGWRLHGEASLIPGGLPFLTPFSGSAVGSGGQLSLAGHRQPECVLSWSRRMYLRIHMGVGASLGFRLSHKPILCPVLPCLEPLVISGAFSCPLAASHAPGCIGVNTGARRCSFRFPQDRAVGRQVLACRAYLGAGMGGARPVDPGPAHWKEKAGHSRPHGHAAAFGPRLALPITTLGLCPPFPTVPLSLNPSPPHCHFPTFCSGCFTA